MPVRLKAGLNLETKIRPDPNSAFKRFSPPTALRLLAEEDGEGMA